MEAARKTLCPRCGSSWVCRAYRIGLIERHLLRAFSLSPYRCDRCDRRFYRRSSSPLPKNRLPSL
jgi:hypothetical protein